MGDDIPHPVSSKSVLHGFIFVMDKSCILDMHGIDIEPPRLTLKSVDFLRQGFCRGSYLREGSIHVHTALQARKPRAPFMPLKTCSHPNSQTRLFRLSAPQIADYKNVLLFLGSLALPDLVSQEPQSHECTAGFPLSASERQLDLFAVFEVVVVNHNAILRIKSHASGPTKSC